MTETRLKVNGFVDILAHLAIHWGCVVVNYSKNDLTH